MITMLYKSEAGTKLDRINRDVGVENKFMDNSPIHTGYNTKIQRVARLERMEVRTTEIYPPWGEKLKFY